MKRVTGDMADFDRIERRKSDRLTGIFTRDYFFARARKMMDENPDKRYDMISINMEKFKLINDLYSVEMGDKYICYIADVLREMCDSDNCVYGYVISDMFALFREREPGYLDRFVEEFSARLREFPIQIELRAKIGVYEVRPEDLKNLIACHDKAYMAGETVKEVYNKRYAYYKPVLSRNLLEEQLMTQDMGVALQEKQFEVYLQSKIDLKTGETVGAEALVRWERSSRVLVEPAKFIPLFEKNGFIYELDKYVWKEVCTILADMKKSGGKVIPISVNVSRKDLFKEDFLDVLKTYISEYDLEARLLHLEITESTFGYEPEILSEVVIELKKCGFVIEMDDFGSGYSSLNALSKLPIDMLKLDMMFMDTEDLTSERSLLKFVIDLAKYLKLPVISEGVETKEQVDALRKLGCDMVQGYYFSKPIPAAEFIEALDGK